VACYSAYKLWRLLDSWATLAFFFSTTYMVVFRFYILFERQFEPSSWTLQNQGYFLLPFWPMFAAGMYLVYRAVRDTLSGR
jgi:hypothetical protein